MGEGVGWHKGGVVPLASDLVKSASAEDKDHDRERIQRHTTIRSLLALAQEDLLLPGAEVAETPGGHVGRGGRKGRQPVRPRLRPPHRVLRGSSTTRATRTDESQYFNDARRARSRRSR